MTVPGFEEYNEEDVKKCVLCKEHFVLDEDYIEEIAQQADRYGMESLTENQQAILENTPICECCR